MTQSMIKKEQPRRVTFGTKVNAPAVKNLINETLGSELKGREFTASLISFVSSNPNLQECEFSSLINGALQAEVLGLKPNNQLGYCYLIPYDLKGRGKVAQFQIGWKGLYFMAMKTGLYKKIIVEVVKDGELVKFDRFNEEIEVKQIEDDEIREKTETIGYYAKFELLNGFTKAIYWSKAKMEHHAETYSKGYAAHKGYTFWEKNFDEMAKKTLLKQLFKFGVLSTKFLQAMDNDQAVITRDEDGEQKVEYIDNESDTLYDSKTGEVDDQVIDEQPVVEPQTIDFDNL